MGPHEGQGAVEVDLYPHSQAIKSLRGQLEHSGRAQEVFDKDGEPNVFVGLAILEELWYDDFLALYQGGRAIQGLIQETEDEWRRALRLELGFFERATKIDRAIRLIEGIESGRIASPSSTSILESTPATIEEMSDEIKHLIGDPQLLLINVGKPVDRPRSDLAFVGHSRRSERLHGEALVQRLRSSAVDQRTLVRQRRQATVIEKQIAWWRYDVVQKLKKNVHRGDFRNWREIHPKPKRREVTPTDKWWMKAFLVAHSKQTKDHVEWSSVWPDWRAAYNTLRQKNVKRNAARARLKRWAKDYDIPWQSDFESSYRRIYSTAKALDSAGLLDSIPE